MPAQSSPNLEDAIGQLRTRASAYFDKVEATLREAPPSEDPFDRQEHRRRDRYWEKLPGELHDEANSIVGELLSLGGQIARAIRSAPLASDADQRDLKEAVKNMRAAVLLRRFESWELEVLNDEDVVLGVRPAGQSDDHPLAPEWARRIFDDSLNRTTAILGLITASSGLAGVADGSSSTQTRYRPGTAFIMIWMDSSKPDLLDVTEAIKGVFAEFDVRAVTAGDIEHEEMITPRIIDEIRTAEFLFADLTGERPNVYYEVGYAHALPRRVILFRKEGTKLHFDLAGYNCPEYKNLTELKQKLRQRLEAVTNRKPKARV